MASLLLIARSWMPRIFLVALLTIPLTFTWLFAPNTWAAVFYTLLTLRYARFRDCTVILPTIDPNGPDFLACIESVLRAGPAAILIVTVGPQLEAECLAVAHNLDRRGTTIAVTSISRASKRRQVARAMREVQTPITVLVDDHVFVGEDILPHIVAPFNNEKVGAVAVSKKVRRTTPGKFSWLSLVNFISCLYLERHNWELRASMGMDGGVFVVSGRTAAYRTEFLGDADLLEQFCSEKFMFGLFGGEGLGADDDNFLTRMAMKKGWLIRFQDVPEATIETTLGEWPKFASQLMRWSRTTVRSNPVMLRDYNFLYRYTWSAFCVYFLGGLTNYALVWDSMLILALVKAGMTSALEILGLIAIMLMSKIAKIMPHIFRHPTDAMLIPVQICFGYVHSFIKFWSVLTFWDCEWSGRNLQEVDAHGGGEDQAERGFTYVM